MNICICSLSDREWLYELTKPNLEKYCDKFNIDFKFVNHTLDEDKATSWSKLILVKRLLSQYAYDYVIWIDDDIVITDFNKDIRDFISGDKNIIIQDDPNRKGKDRLEYDDINCGFIFFRRSKETIDMINKIQMMGEWTPYTRCRNWEQPIFIQYYNEIDKSFDIRKYRTFQSFCRGIGEDTEWREGDFSAHLSGISQEQRINLMKNQFYIYL